MLNLDIMIKTFNNKETKKIFDRQASKKFQSIERIALRKLVILDAATTLSDIRVPPGNHLESLKGGRRGQHSIRISDKWRICFVWRDGNAYYVEIIDYH